MTRVDERINTVDGRRDLRDRAKRSLAYQFQARVATSGTNQFRAKGWSEFGPYPCDQKGDEEEERDLGVSPCGRVRLQSNAMLTIK